MIDLATAKEHLRVEGTDEDTLIVAYLAAAQGAVQKATGKLLTSQAVAQDFAGFPARDRPLRLWNGPVSAILSIDYDQESDGTEQVLGDFRLVDGIVAQLLPAYGSCWPRAKCAPGSVRVAYTAGYDGDVPPELDQAVLLLVGHYYDNRSAVQAGERAAAVELPAAVDMLLAPYSAPGIG